MSVIGILQQLTARNVLGAIISSVMWLLGRRTVQTYALCLTTILIISAVPAYAGNIEEFQKRIRDVNQTAEKAEQIGELLRHQDASSNLPRTSDGLTMEANQKVDAWGSVFCIIPIAERVAIVSGGPSHLSCDALPWTAGQIAKSEQGLHFGPADVVMFIAYRPWQSSE